MGTVDYIAIAVIVLIVGAAMFYIIRAKKSGKKCIGCPDGCSCCKLKDGQSCGSSDSCHCDNH